MAYGHVSAIRSDSLSSDHSIINPGLQATGGANYNAIPNTGEAAEHNAALHVPMSTLEEMAAAVVGHASKSQADESLAAMTSGPNLVTYTTILNPTSSIPPAVAGNSELGRGGPTGTTPMAPDSWVSRARQRARGEECNAHLPLYYTIGPVLWPTDAGICVAVRYLCVMG
jgi:hypothetical protein